LVIVSVRISTVLVIVVVIAALFGAGLLLLELSTIKKAEVQI